jgi:hypothetical protein
MKGSGPRFWSRYVFEACLPHEWETLFLTGLPDVEESRPHSRADR